MGCAHLASQAMFARRPDVHVPNDAGNRAPDMRSNPRAAEPLSIAAPTKPSLTQPFRNGIKPAVVVRRGGLRHVQVHGGIWIGRYGARRRNSPTRNRRKQGSHLLLHPREDLIIAV